MPDVAIVTGSSSGLGKSISDRLLSSGYTVVGVSRRSAEQQTEGLIHVQGSVADQPTVDAAFAAAAAAGSLKLVVNCAGQGVFGPVGSYANADIRKAIEGNLLGLIAFSDRAFTEFADHGDIVNVMSTASKKLRTAESVYTAAKWGAKAYTRTLREAAKAGKLPIRVFEVYPCGMNTRFWDEAIRPPANGSAFPSAETIADAVVGAVLASGDAYQQELTFERS